MEHHVKMLELTIDYGFFLVIKLPYLMKEILIQSILIDV